MYVFHADKVWEVLLNPTEKMWTSWTILDQIVYFKGIFLWILSDCNMIFYLPWKQLSLPKYTEGKSIFLEKSWETY